ncbi:helix-turn-helix domain-containing protein [Vibrio sp. D173a]|uniref:helix-turn-helix domain-containing protein n=1 Tax=Vibrio TaxID=662 RepID=UPI0009A49A0E|nr:MULTISPECIES: helix-turn-helix domain-containing protein [Vibrio]MDK9756993.1 helix-turn-helix domain-containing protein [Vibrio sp. D173a]OPH52895.1 AraC family transcriptional regulator [Vibrio campbellii]
MAYIEKIPQRPGFSWRYRRIDESTKQSDLHFHDDVYELVIHRHFDGVLNVGHCEMDIEHNQMLLIAPGVPHSFCSTSPKDNCETHVVWFKREWISNLMFYCTELRKLDPLLKAANKGVVFSKGTAQQVVDLMHELMKVPAMEQLARFIHVLSLLAHDEAAKTLMTHSYLSLSEHEQQERERVAKVNGYLEQHFARKITLADLANDLSLSESAVTRLFQKHFKEPFSQRLMKLRINHAAELLQSTELPIGIVFERVGYRNQALFNRHFKTYKGLTPRDYRQHYQQRIQP